MEQVPILSNPLHLRINLLRLAVVVVLLRLAIVVVLLGDKVGCHDDHGVGEVHLFAFAVREYAVVEHLK